MKKKSNQLKLILFRLFLILPIVVIGIVGYRMFFLNETVILGEFILLDEDLAPIRLSEEGSADGFPIFARGNQLGSGWYGLHITTAQDDAFSFINEGSLIDFNNALTLNEEQDSLYVIFENIAPEPDPFGNRPIARERFILKIFYEFEEVAFKVANQPSFETEFLFNLSEGYQIQIPLQLSEVVARTAQSQHLTIAIFANPHYNTVNPLAEWYSDCATCLTRFVLNNHGTGVVRNFTVSFYADMDLLFDDQERNENTDDFSFVGFHFFVNPDFLNEHAPGVLSSSEPPSPWTVSTGSEVEIGFAVFNGSEPASDGSIIALEDFEMIGLLNWNQIELSNKTYFAENLTNWTDSEVELIEGSFTIIAPDEPGYYDFIVFAVGNPNTPYDFQNGSIAMRFTLRVR